MVEIHGIDVELLKKTQTGVDPFGAPIFTEIPEIVHDVIVSPMTETEILDTINLTGRKAVYRLAIPKHDGHDWELHRIRFFGEIWQAVGIPQQGIDDMMPLRWNKILRVERCE